MIELDKALLVGLTIASMTAAGCHKDPSVTTAPAPSAKSKPAELPLSDTSINAAVTQVLQHDPGIDASGLHVATTDGIVELTGEASNLLTKLRAARVVEAVRGVRAVSDRTALSKVARPDPDITKDVKNALLTNAAADSYEVTVKVESGKVTLTGSVQSHQEREMARRLAEGVLGVKAVDNQIQIQHEVARSDAEVAADVTSRLRWDALVNDGLIDVAVHGGNVFLSGKVASANEKRRAAVDAWVLGAGNVDDTGLKVDALAEQRDYLKHKLFTRSTSDVEKAVRAALAYDPRVGAANVSVTVDNGKARLQGDVGSVAARFAAEDLARHTVGVMGVQNDLAVKPKKKHADAEVERAVRAGLLWDPFTNSQEILVKANAGKVTLTGRVESRFQRAEATDVAAGIEGVKDIDNLLGVERGEVAYVFDSYIFPYSPFWETWSAVPSSTAHSDSEITRTIHDEFEWNPMLDPKDVNVRVRNGHATLTGRVNSQGQRIQATEEAYEGGAVAVDNQLTLASGG